MGDRDDAASRYSTDEFDEPPGYDVFLDGTVRNKATILDETRDAYAAALVLARQGPEHDQPGRHRRRDRPAARHEEGDHGLRVRRLLAAARGRRHRGGPGVLVGLPARRGAQRHARVHASRGRRAALGRQLAIPTDAPRQEAAEQFISYYLRPEVSAGVSKYVQVVQVRDAHHFVDDDFDGWQESEPARPLFPRPGAKRHKYLVADEVVVGLRSTGRRVLDPHEVDGVHILQAVDQRLRKRSFARTTSTCLRSWDALQGFRP